MSRSTAAAAALVLALSTGGLAGCGSGDAAALSASATDALHTDIEAVRTAVARDRDPAALAAVKDLRATVRQLADRGELHPADAQVLLTQVDRIAAKLAGRSTSGPASSPSPTATPPASGPDDEDNDDEDEDDKGNGKGKGNDKSKGRTG